MADKLSPYELVFNKSVISQDSAGKVREKTAGARAAAEAARSYNFRGQAGTSTNLHDVRRKMAWDRGTADADTPQG